MVWGRYQKVAGNRPLVFLLGGSKAVPHLAEALELLRQHSTAIGLGEPFFFMMQNAPTAAALRQLANDSAAIGATGLSQYNLVGNRTAAGFPYAENMQFEQGWWRDAAATGICSTQEFSCSLNQFCIGILDHFGC